MCTSQMKKRLRAEIYEAFIKMGLEGLLVDAVVWETARERLASTQLCGNHAKPRDPSHQLPPPPPLDAPSQKRQAPSDSARQQPAKRQRAERYRVEQILAEEPPSCQVWHRYLVRWQGYKLEWESWRLPGRGTPGSGPIDTWEKATSVRKYHKAALAEWEAAKAAATGAATVSQA